jgi:FtsH-binding integral membrane protein
MMGLGIVICTIGIFITGLSAYGYVSGHEPSGVAGMVIGAGLFIIGVLIFLAYFVLQITRQGFNMSLRGRLFSLELIIRGRLGIARGEPSEPEENGDDWLIRGA